MTSKSLKTAGLLAMASAFLTLPLAFLSYTLQGRNDSEAASTLTIIQIVGTILFIAIILLLRKFLHDFFAYRAVDRNLALIIITDVTAGVLSIVSLYMPGVKEPAGYAALAILVVQGIIQMQFGYRLLKLPHDLGGLLKPFCYANIATGLLLASIVLIPLGILASALSDLMLGTIFLNTCRAVKNSENKAAL